MIDREKIINALNICLGHGKCKDCGYTNIGKGYSTMDCRKSMMQDILELLKEQEPRTPHYTHLEYLVNGKVVEVNHPECPRCFENGLDLWSAEIEKGQAYCKRCGQKVIWNDD